MGSGSKIDGASIPSNRRDPYEVLSVSKDANDQDIKTAYRKLALKYVLISLFVIVYIHDDVVIVVEAVVFLSVKLMINY